MNLQARSPWGHRRSVLRSAARRETSTQAQELFKDADAAQKFFSKVQRKPKKLRASSVRLVHNAAPILRIVDVQRPCFGAILAVLPSALNAALAAWHY